MSSPQRARSIIAMALVLTYTMAAGAVAGTEFVLKLGFLQSRLYVAGWEWSDWNSGIVTGVFASIEISDHWAIELGVAYAEGDGSFTDMPSHPDGSLEWVDEASYSSEYLEVPVLARYRPSPNASVPVVLLAGLSWNAPLSSSWRFNGGEKGDWAEAYLGASFGVGLEFPVGGSTGRGEVLYNSSLTSVGNAESFMDDGKIASIAIQAGFVF